MAIEQQVAQLGRNFTYVGSQYLIMDTVWPKVCPGVVFHHNGLVEGLALTYLIWCAGSLIGLPFMSIASVSARVVSTFGTSNKLAVIPFAVIMILGGVCLSAFLAFPFSTYLLAFLFPKVITVSDLGQAYIAHIIGVVYGFLVVGVGVAPAKEDK